MQLLLISFNLKYIIFIFTFNVFFSINKIIIELKFFYNIINIY